jgi:regulatory protein
MINASIIHYCQYQERCHSEVRNKLYESGFATPDVEQQISALIEAGLLNEERYARAYARGKFRMMQWGREKIKQQLKARKISAYCIRKGLEEIDETEYENTLNKISSKKWQEYKKEKHPAIRKSKLYRYLIQKGYERELVTDVINNCLK